MLKKRLLNRLQVFEQIFQIFLEHNYYKNININMCKLDCENYTFPDIPMSNFPLIPYIESVWENKTTKRTISCRIYDNYMTNIYIYNDEYKKSISVNDYKKKKEKVNIEIHLFSGTIDEKFNTYLKTTLEYINQTELLSIIKGEVWIDIPFDWQNQK